MKPLTKTQILERMLKNGCTAMDLCRAMGTVSPHKRMSELKARGWTITRTEIKGKSFGRYKGRPPQSKPKTVFAGGKNPFTNHKE